MVEYYKLDVLEETEYNEALWRKIYFGMNDEKSSILVYPSNAIKTLDLKMICVSEEEAIGILEEC